MSAKGSCLVRPQPFCRHALAGAVESTVGKIKTLTRQMYGRAGFDLLRRRVLLA